MPMPIKIICLAILLFFYADSVWSQPNISIRKRDLKKDVLIITDSGKMVVRLNNTTQAHRNNFIQLVKSGFYRNISFHRVISNFMIQAGDEKTKQGLDTGKLTKNYTLPAEFRNELFHKKGVIAAARMGDNVNPKKESSGTQFYIVQGRIFTDAGLDSVETFRLQGRKLPPEHREVYKTIGGTPHLDQNYTVFGELISGWEVIDKIAYTKTTGRQGGDKPLTEIRIRDMKLIQRAR